MFARSSARLKPPMSGSRHLLNAGPRPLRSEPLGLNSGVTQGPPRRPSRRLLLPPGSALAMGCRAAREQTGERRRPRHLAFPFGCRCGSRGNRGRVPGPRRAATPGPLQVAAPTCVARACLRTVMSSFARSATTCKRSRWCSITNASTRDASTQVRRRLGGNPSQSRIADRRRHRQFSRG